MYAFRDEDLDLEDEDDELNDALKKAYHEGMKDGIRYAKKRKGFGLRHDRDEDDDIIMYRRVSRDTDGRFI